MSFFHLVQSTFSFTNSINTAVTIFFPIIYFDRSFFIFSIMSNSHRYAIRWIYFTFHTLRRFFLRIRRNVSVHAKTHKVRVQLFLSRHCKPHFCAYPAKTRMSIHKKANYEKKNSNRKEITKRTREGERNIKRIFIKNSNASFLCMHLNGYCYCVANPSRCSSFFYILYRAEWYI